MRYRELPLGIQKLVEDDYKRHMQEDFKAQEGEVMFAFFHEQEIQDKWVEFRKANYQLHLDEAEQEGSWDNYLTDQLGIQP